jgi:hypothetical protein
MSDISLAIFVPLVLAAVHLNRVGLWMQGGLKQFWSDSGNVAILSKALFVATLLSAAFLPFVASRPVGFVTVTVLFLSHMGLVICISNKKR